MAASILSPVLMISSKGFLCAITISAPVFSSPILRHASVRLFTASPAVPRLLPARRPSILSAKALPRVLLMYRFPSLMRNLRISGWNITIRARTPTSRTVSMSAVISLMLKAETTTRMMYSDMIATNMLMAEEPLIHLNMMNMISARRSMSRMSASDNCRNPKIAGVIAEC